MTGVSFSLTGTDSAACKGIYSLLLAKGARDWMEDKALDMVQYANLGTDIHHIFPKQWCAEHEIDDERRESIVNKSAITARTNRAIGGSPPSSYLETVESRAQISAARLGELLDGHLVTASLLRDDDFDGFFADRRERLCLMIEEAMGKVVQRDVDEGESTEGSEEFEPEPEDREPELPVIRVLPAPLVSGREYLLAADFDFVVGGQEVGGLAVLGLTSSSQQMREEGERATARSGDDLTSIWIDDRERPTIFHGFGKDRIEGLLVGGDEGGPLGIAIRVEHGLNQPFVRDFAGPGELAALRSVHARLRSRCHLCGRARATVGERVESLRCDVGFVGPDDRAGVGVCL